MVSQHALEQVSGGRVRWGLGVSQHTLQVSRPTPKGDVEGDLARGVSRPTPKGEVEGDLAGWVSRPTPRGRGVSRPTPGGYLLWGYVCSRGVAAPGGVETPP